MVEFLASPRLIELIMAVILVELVAVFAWHHATGRGPRPLLLLPNLAAGFFLLLALWVVLTDAPTVLVPLALAASFGWHLLDLRWRWPPAAARTRR